MPSAPHLVADLTDRAVIEVAGPDWRGFLQGLLTQDVETLAAGEIRFGALLTPQGRLLFDLFLIGWGEGCLIDCEASRRDALIQRLMIYRLRAKVEIKPATSPSRRSGARSSPRSGAAIPGSGELGYRGYGLAAARQRRPGGL